MLQTISMALSEYTLEFHGISFEIVRCSGWEWVFGHTFLLHKADRPDLIKTPDNLDATAVDDRLITNRKKAEMNMRESRSTTYDLCVTACV